MQYAKGYTYLETESVKYNDEKKRLLSAIIYVA